MKRICNNPFNSAGMHNGSPFSIKKSLSAFLALVLSLYFALFFSITAFATAKNANEERIMLYPGGMPFGVRIKTKGVIIVGLTDFQTPEGIKSPGGDSGLMVGDVIEKVSGNEILSCDDISSLVKSSRGEDMLFEIKRQGKTIAVRIKAEISSEDNSYRIGLFLKDSAAGIGTLTFLSEDKKTFAGLGHGICNNESRQLMPFSEGSVYDVIVTGIIKGKQGTPGELHGKLSSVPSGKLYNNLYCGVFGKYDAELDIDESSLMECARADEIKEGEAYILTSIDSGIVQKYRINISHLELQGKPDKNFSIIVNDERLISKTGGIVQGMSGSPIIQNGRIIGALTHVLVDDPLCGYGIWVENMLNNMPNEQVKHN